MAPVWKNLAKMVKVVHDVVETLKSLKEALLAPEKDPDNKDK